MAKYCRWMRCSCELPAGLSVRILIYSTHFAPEQIGIGKFTGEMVAWLAGQGHEVRVVAPQPYYPDWRVMSGHRSDRYSRSPWEGAIVWRCPVWIPRRPSGIKRILHYVSIAMSSAPVVLRQFLWKPDVVFVVVPTIMCAPVALLVAKLSGATSWMHVQDFEVAAAVETGLLRSPVLRKIASFVEPRILRAFDRVSTISPQMMDGLAARGVPAERRVLFRNWVDVQAIHPLEGGNSFREELGLSADTLVVLYSGNMAAKQGLETLLEAARLLDGDGSLRFVLCGNGAAREKLQHDFSDLRSVIWLPLQPFSRLNDLLNLADIHALLQIAGVADLVMPSKLTGMLASGRPIVATALEGTQVAEVVARCGINVPPGDAAAFAAAIRDLGADRAKRQSLGKVAREYAIEHLDSSRVLREFEHAVIDCCEQGRRSTAAV